MSRRFGILSLVAALPMSVAVPAEAGAQTREERTYKPTGSHIARALPPSEVRALERDRAASIVNMFGNCMVEEAGAKALELVQETDFGITSFAQIGVTNDDVRRSLEIDKCYQRAISAKADPGMQTTIKLRPQNIRAYLLRGLYLRYFPDGATWTTQAGESLSRIYPVSAAQPSVHVAMEFADCVVDTDPEGADLFLRTGEGGKRETVAIQQLMPALSACLNEETAVEFTPYALRSMVAEGLWQAATQRRMASGPFEGQDTP